MSRLKENIKIIIFGTNTKAGKLFDEILIIFKKYKLLGLFLSGLLAPLTYYLGEPIGVIKIYNFQAFIILMILFWVILMIYYLNYVLKSN